MNYADLEIRILKKDTTGYPVEITFNGELEFPRGVLSAELPVLTAGAPSGQDGELLFQWLFSDDALKAAWANARGQRPQRRIRLRIDEGAPELHQIPWELLRDIGEGGVPLDLSALDSTPFSRYIAGPWIPGSPILKRPIRVLVAIANPGNLADFGLSAIDPDAEFKLLQDAVAGNSKIELVKLEGLCTLDAIDAALRKGIHILHFIGHGKYVDGTSVLFLSDPRDKEKVALVKDAAIAAMLGRQLADAQSDDKLRLVYLSSCQTATRSPADAFRGLAPSLVAAGVPAVLAMQDLVPIKTATEFSRTFYRELLDHGEVDRASNAARSSVMSAGLPGAAIPVLFMRLRSGQLLGNRGVIVGSRGESFWQTLLENIAEKECTPFLGSGVTADLLPRPEELAHQLAEKFSYPFPDHANLPRVTQFIGTIDNRRLRKQLLSVLVEQFRKRMGLPAVKPGMPQTLSQAIEAAEWAKTSLDLFEGEIHHQLADLELPLYLTTNIDNFMTLALQAKQGKARREVVPWRDASMQRRDLNPPASPEDPVVLHLLGTDADLLSMVVTEDDHLDYLSRISHDHEYFLPVSVNERLACTTLLFLGYRLEDLDLKIIMRGLLTHLDLQRWNMLHVAVQLESSQRDDAREKEVIDYFQKYFSESRIDIYWGNTLQFMSDLSARWKEYRNA
ncbi:MAG: CHAT domain-containing protein [Candidatus Solibacter sp.]|nr:CHAT domain-containing protein [Candidatus Solibacter sp.]